MRTMIPRLAALGGTLLAGLLLIQPLAAQADTSHAMAHDAMAHDDAAAMGKSPHGTFTGLSNHRSSGGFEIVTTNGEHELRLSPDFSLDQAPDVYVVLSASTAVDSKSLYLGRLRKLSGPSTFSIPSGTDLGSFSHVVLWCKKFSVALADASLEAGDAMMHH